MIAITVTYKGPTNTRGSRFLVRDGDSTTFVPYDSALPAALRARAAAVVAIARQDVGQANGLVKGQLPGNVSVFVRTLPCHAGYVEHCGRKFRVLTTFPDSEDGTLLANLYMENRKGACLLTIQDGLLYLADCNDKGKNL